MYGTAESRSHGGARRRMFCGAAWLALAVIGGLVCGAAWAQDDNRNKAPEALATIPVPPLDSTDADRDDTTTPLALEELVVTASKTGDTLSETPISVTITPDIELRETDITDVETLSDRLPNAQLALTPTNSFLFIRGLGTGSVRSAEQSVGFFVDGVFLGRPQVALFDFLDVSQVEVLRGPQGAVLGKNTVAGAVNVQTAPVTRYTEGYAEALTGSDDQWRGRAALSAALSDTVAARIAVAKTDEDGYLYNTTQQRDDLARPGQAGRAKLLWTPGARQSYEITVQAARIEQNGDSFELSQASDQLLALYRRFDPATSTDITDNRTHTDHAPAGGLLEGEDLFLHADWDLDFGLLRLIAAASDQDTTADLDLDISPVPFLTLPSNETYRQRSVELRLDKDLGWSELSAGLYYFQADLDLRVDIAAFANGVDDLLANLLDGSSGSELGSTLFGRLGELLAGPGGAQLGAGRSIHQLIQSQRTLSGFGSLRWPLSDTWTLRLDGRVTRETKSGDQSITFDGTTGPLLGAALGEEEYDLQAERSETDFSPRLSLLTDWTDRLSSYITAARGFKSGGFNNLAAVPERAEFDEERSLTYEAGLRLASWHGFSGSLGLFRTDFDNLQIAALDGTEFFVGNAAEAHTQGIELDLRWQSGFGLMAGAQLGYLDAKYDRYTNAPAQAGSDEGSDDPNDEGGQDLSDRVLQRAPEYSGSLQLGFIGALPWMHLPFALGVVAEGASHQFLNVDLDPIDSQPGYLRYNAFVGLSDGSGRLTLRLIGRNLTDETVRREAADIALVGAHSVGVYPPRRFAAELGYRF